MAQVKSKNSKSSAYDVHSQGYGAEDDYFGADNRNGTDYLSLLQISTRISEALTRPYPTLAPVDSKTYKIF